MHLKFIILTLLTGLVISTTAQTVFEQGDIVILGVNANNSCGEPRDIISFMSFKDITSGTEIDFTDNGWERLYAGFWGTTEGVLRLTRTGGTIPAGTVITVLINNNSITGISPDTDWSSTNLNPTYNLDLSQNGDQIFIMQGGDWDVITQHQGTYDGIVLFGFSTSGSWSAFTGSNLGTQNSVVYPGMLCLNLSPTSDSEYNKYTGETSATNQRVWLNRISDPANWTNYDDCIDYISSAPLYQSGLNLGITFGGFRDGYWLGSTDSDWFNCENWENMLVPDATTDVLIRPLDATEGPFEDAIISNAEQAVVHSIDIQAGANITMQPGSELLVQENIRNNGNFDVSGEIVLEGNEESLIWGASGLNVQQLTLNKSSGAGIQADTLVVVKSGGNLQFTSGILTPTGANRVEFENNATATGASNNSFVSGSVRKTGNQNFEFPVGDDGFYQPIGIENITSPGSVYQAQFFNQNGPGIYGYDWEPSITNVATCNYWILEQTSGTSARVRLSWGNDINCDINEPADLVVSRFNSSMWVNHGQQSFTGNATAGSVLSADNITDFGPFALASITEQNPLPVTWLHFNAERKPNQMVELAWSTASEQNNHYFAIEHSADGLFYNELNRISGAGSSSEIRNYSWLHQRPNREENYYRIKQVDFNGDFSYSSIQVVTIEQQDDYEISFSDHLLRIVLNTEVSNAQLQVYDATGKLMMNEVSRSGKQFDWPLHHLSGGVYFIRFQSDAIHFTEKIFW